MPPNLLPVDYLRELHNEDADEAPQRDILLCVEPAPDVREVTKALLENIFPGYAVESTSYDEAIDLVSGETRERLALITLDLEDRAVAESILDILYGAGETATPRLNSVPALGTYAEAASDRMTTMSELDGIIAKPFGLNEFQHALSEAILKKGGVWERAETESRISFLKELGKDYKNRAVVWASDLMALGAYSEGDARVVEDVSTIIEALEKFPKLMKLLDVASSEAADSDWKAACGKFIHDMNNCLSIVLSYLEFLLNDTDTGIDQDVLKALLGESQRFASILLQMRQVLSKTLAWQDLSFEQKPSSFKHQNLDIPKGLSVCVVDDSQTIAKVVGRDVENAGGTTHWASSAESINAGPYGVALVLLDDDLEGDLMGHQLIEAIREKWPTALIVAHTSSAAEINLDPDTPYKAAGVEVIGKRDWSALSGIVRRKFNTQAE